ncbi:ribonuclease HI [Pseudoalteromonas umbrosa]|uniref:ribonuclease HI n=1 Tax=Pseudoalteromonas umbrosa TaxID=3048489 RepID=UPI0024C41E37|nr:RNase H family protein [Pseudoalteromonas sp. B95]MDK1290182.1 hypothetical protein [Pseudoalteromonas sp. B95]
MAKRNPTCQQLRTALDPERLAEQLAYALPRAYSRPALYLFCDGGVVYRRDKISNKVDSTGPGGWGCAFLLVDEDTSAYLSCLRGNHPNTTNNQMELHAVNHALLQLKELDDISTGQVRLHIISDSQYVVKGATQWLDGWKARHFEGVKNLPYWQQFLLASQGLKPTWHHCRGHRNAADFPARSWDKFTAIGNDIADKLATLGRLELTSQKSR